MAIVKVDACKCNKCGHIWISSKYNTKDNLPVSCAKCKSPHWNK